MDWGYESETGQVWLFNVTPFTPHLPHWHLWLLHAQCGLCAVRRADCIVNACARFASRSAGPLMCTDTFCSLTRTFNTCAHFGQALNHMNNKRDRQAANAQHMFLGDVLVLKCSGACCSARKLERAVYEREHFLCALQAGVTWM